MKMKNLFASALFAMLLMVGTAPLMVSCDKEDTPGETPDNPNNPNNPNNPTGNYVQYDGQTYTPSMLITTEEEGMYVLSLLFGDGGSALSFVAATPFEDNTYNVSDNYLALLSGGVVGMIYFSDEPMFFSGTLTITHTGDVYTIDFQGATTSAHYEGVITDINAETGEGTLTIGEQTIDVSHGAIYTDNEEGISYQAISLAGDDGDITFATLNTFTSGEYTLIAASDVTMLQPNTAACEISYTDPSTDEYVEIIVSSGRLQININDGTYTINAYGTTEDETVVQLNYTGTLNNIAFKKISKR